jgi:hypothetical protein
MAQRTSTNVSRKKLQPFSGRVLLGICFERGHSIWLYDFESTPTGLGSYREFWVVEPDDTRTLYYDKEGADAEIAAFHDWSRSALSEMEWEWTTDHIDIIVNGSEGTTIKFEGTVDDSAMSRVLTLMQRYLPGPLHKRMFGRHTETGRFGHLKTPSVRVVTQATARIDGKSLGAVQPPDQPVTFGEVSAFDHPYVFVGDLLLEYSVG